MTLARRTTTPEGDADVFELLPIWVLLFIIMLTLVDIREALNRISPPPPPNQEKDA